LTNITDYILSKTQILASKVEKIKPEYQQFNSGSVEVEVAEFLYSLVRLVKPERIVETGTHKGISALYMALALERNEKGKLITFEIIESLLQEAQALWDDLGMRHRIQELLQSSLITFSCAPIDILFLDSEPNLRFDEFVLYWQWLKPGGLIAIHDLGNHLGHTDNTVNGMYDWPYGDFREKIGCYIKNHQVQTMGFPTGRGFTVFQKEAPRFGWTKYIRE